MSSGRLGKAIDFAERQVFRKDGKSFRFEKSSNWSVLRDSVGELDKCQAPLPRNEYASLLRQCINLKAITAGRRVHAHILKRGILDTFLGNLLIQMYGRSGCTQDARNTFDAIAAKNIYSWNLFVCAYAENENLFEASKSCDKMTIIKHVKFMFEKMPQQDVVSWTTMLSVYAKSGNLVKARMLFDEMPVRNLVSWTALVAGYALYGHGKEAVKLFKQMILQGMSLNDITFLSVLDACTDLAELRATHMMIVESGYISDLKVGNSLITMYGRYGRCDYAAAIFESMTRKNLVSWNGLITAYVGNNLGISALLLFASMQLEGKQPDEITLIGVLSGCSHQGMLEYARQAFLTFYDYGWPTADHYVCMVDLLGRGGHLAQARELLENMPFEPNAVAWRTLVFASNVHKDKNAS